jgi:uncharacterized protein YneF (UPF0154 family)
MYPPSPSPRWRQRLWLTVAGVTIGVVLALVGFVVVGLFVAATHVSNNWTGK